MKTLQQATREATRHLLRSTKARTYQTPPNAWGERASYELKLKRDATDKTQLTITTWGFDCEGITIPQTRPQLINLKMRASFNRNDSANQVALRYYFDILRRESSG